MKQQAKNRSLDILLHDLKLLQRDPEVSPRLMGDIISPTRTCQDLSRRHPHPISKLPHFAPSNFLNFSVSKNEPRKMSASANAPWNRPPVDVRFANEQDLEVLGLYRTCPHQKTSSYTTYIEVRCLVASSSGCSEYHSFKRGSEEK